MPLTGSELCCSVTVLSAAAALPSLCRRELEDAITGLVQSASRSSEAELARIQAEIEDDMQAAIESTRQELEQMLERKKQDAVHNVRPATRACVY